MSYVKAGGGGWRGGDTVIRVSPEQIITRSARAISKEAFRANGKLFSSGLESVSLQCYSLN